MQLYFLMLHLSFFLLLWQQLAKYIDGNHLKFKTFVIFHVKMCRLILIIILVPQVFESSFKIMNFKSILSVLQENIVFYNCDDITIKNC